MINSIALMKDEQYMIRTWVELSHQQMHRLFIARHLKVNNFFICFLIHWINNIASNIFKVFSNHFYYKVYSAIICYTRYPKLAASLINSVFLTLIFIRKNSFDVFGHVKDTASHPIWSFMRWGSVWRRPASIRFACSDRKRGGN